MPGVVIKDQGWGRPIQAGVKAVPGWRKPKLPQWHLPTLAQLGEEAPLLPGAGLLMSPVAGCLSTAPSRVVLSLRSRGILARVQVSVILRDLSEFHLMLPPEGFSQPS